MHSDPSGFGIDAELLRRKWKQPRSRRAPHDHGRIGDRDGRQRAVDQNTPVLRLNRAYNVAELRQEWLDRADRREAVAGETERRPILFDRISRGVTQEDVQPDLSRRTGWPPNQLVERDQQLARGIRAVFRKRQKLEVFSEGADQHRRGRILELLALAGRESADVLGLFELERDLHPWRLRVIRG